MEKQVCFLKRCVTQTQVDSLDFNETRLSHCAVAVFIGITFFLSANRANRSDSYTPYGTSSSLMNINKRNKLLSY